MKHMSVWDQLVQLPYLNLYGKVVSSALELDVFSHLQEKKTPAELARAMGWNESNTGYLLATLGTYGFLQKVGDGYINSQDAQKYLVRGTPDYLGGFIHFYGQNEGMVPMDVKKLLTVGPQPMPQMEMEQNLDFAQYGQMLCMSEEGYRQQEILRMVRNLPENGEIRRVLDVGCAAGLLGLAVIGDVENRSGVLLDQIPSQIIQASVDAAGLRERVKVVQGNFLTDDLGGGYDLILAVSIMLFAKGGMEPLMKKFFDALNPGGVLLVVSEGIAEDLSGPWDMMTGYLPYFLNGMDLAVRAGEVEAAARAAGFTKIESRTEQLCSGTQDTPDAGTTQAAGSAVDSNNYATYEEMVEAYRSDIESIQAGDEYGNNLVELYNPLNYIGAEDTENPTWVKILCGAAEGDISMFNSLNLQIAMLNSGIDAEIEWQWDGGHVPSEVLGDSFSLYVDQMYGEYVEGAAAITKAAVQPLTANGTAAEATGTDLTSWVSLTDGQISFPLADAAAYRTAGASKAMPAFDVIDYGQEDYVFGTTEQDARHWDPILLDIFETYSDVLAPLFNSGTAQ